MSRKKKGQPENLIALTYYALNAISSKPSPGRTQTLADCR